MPYQIRMLGNRAEVNSTGELVKKLSEVNGSVSVIHKQGPSEGDRVVFVDVADGVIRQSYGEHQVLKAADFEVGGLAFR